MSRLDRHVAMVQNKLALGRFFDALAWTSLAYVALVWLAIVVDRVIQLRLPRQGWWMLGGASAAILVALIYAIWRRPSAKDAAVAIDDRLALKEKFSTALYVRSLSDPFAKAAVLDAERTAENVSLNKRFPLSFPRAFLSTAAVALLAFLTAEFLKPMDLFGREEQRKQIAEVERKKDDAKKDIEQKLAVVNAQAQGVADPETIKLAKRDLESLLRQPVADPEKAQRSAQMAMQQMAAALKQQQLNSAKFAEAKSDEKLLKQIAPADDDKGPVAEARRDMAKGEFTDAINELEKAVDKFDKMDQKDKEQAAEQMKQMATQLQKMAEDPKVQQQIQKQLQQMGASQQQAQQMAQQMQAAAQGNQQAQQQLAQQAQKMMQQVQQQAQAGNQQAQQQLAQMQQMMQQMQASANTQQQAAQMQQAAQKMAQGMQQAAKSGQQPGQQPGQGQQQMAQGKTAMQQQLQQMQAMAQDAKSLEAAQASASQCAGGNCNGNGQQNQNQQQANAGGQGQWKQGDNRNFKGPGPGGGAGIGAGDRTFKEEAPYDVKKELSPSEDIDSGKILASTLIKAPSEKGVSKVGLSEAIASAEKDATDEVEEDRISRQAQNAVKDYFSSVKKDAPAK